MFAAQCLYSVNLNSMLEQAVLTTRQEQVLGFIQDRQRESGFVPSLREIANHFGFKSPNSVRQHLRLIEKKGLVHRLPGRSRALVLTRNGYSSDSDSVYVPLLGRIPAGAPIVAQEEAEALLPLPALLFRGGRLFALRVRGTSMIGAGILDGDIAVLDAMAEVKNGSIAAVLIETDATLKRVFCGPEGLLLKAENPAFPEIKVPTSEVQRARILGLLVGVVRKI
jgi:repressor LexA